MRSNAVAATEKQRPEGQRRLDFVKGFFDAVFAAVPGDNGLRRHLGRRSMDLKTGDPEHSLSCMTSRRVHAKRDLPGLHRGPPHCCQVKDTENFCSGRNIVLLT